MFAINLVRRLYAPSDGRDRAHYAPLPRSHSINLFIHLFAPIYFSTDSLHSFVHSSFICLLPIHRFTLHSPGCSSSEVNEQPRISSSGRSFSSLFSLSPPVRNHRVMRVRAPSQQGWHAAPSLPTNSDVHMLDYITLFVWFWWSCFTEEETYRLPLETPVPQPDTHTLHIVRVEFTSSAGAYWEGMGGTGGYF